MGTLDKIVNANDIKNLKPNEYEDLANDIRLFLLDSISRTGGHLASNLGNVELIMALHLVLDFPKDKLIFDVGHQAYTHKILTGRKDGFSTLRKYGGMSGFPKTSESDTDCFNTGHSSTSISAAVGMAEARQLSGTDERIVAVIGDGSFSGGLCYEGLNNLAHINSNCIIILNDNDMSITENVGGMSKYFNKIRLGSAYNDLKLDIENLFKNVPNGTEIVRKMKRSKDSLKSMVIPGMFFEDMGIKYIGPVDGHNLNELVNTFKAGLQLDFPILIHVKTKKGKGYRYAEKYPSHFHGVEPFDLKTGKPLKKKEKASYTDVFGRKLLSLAGDNDKIVAITAAMQTGTGLAKFCESFPNRLFDVGIAEQHAVTFAAGLACRGYIPVVAVYSSFLQRAYDQILHDVCLQKLHVIFAIDRSGLVGADGETHQGIFDVSYLNHIPNLTIIAPKNRYELSRCLEYAVDYDGPIAIKYSRGDAYYGLKDVQEPIEHGKSEIIYNGKDIAIFAVGNMVEEAVSVCDILREEGYNPTLVNARFVKPIDYEMIDYIATSHSLICTMEENVAIGGYGNQIESYLFEKEITVKSVNASINDMFVVHGSVSELREMLGIDAKSVAARIIDKIKE